MGQPREVLEYQLESYGRGEGDRELASHNNGRGREAEFIA